MARPPKHVAGLRLDLLGLGPPLRPLREAGRLFGRCEHASLKVRPRTAPGPLLSKAPSTLERMSILAAAFRTSTALGVGINVALTRWIRRVVFVGTAAPARPCGHAFFMFRFLARGSAGI